MNDKERKEYIDKMPIQKYVVGDNKICPLCGGKLSDYLLISSPPQRDCEKCGRRITVY